MSENTNPVTWYEFYCQCDDKNVWSLNPNAECKSCSQPMVSIRKVVKENGEYWPVP